MQAFSNSCLSEKNSFFKDPSYQELVKKEYDNTRASCIYKDSHKKTKSISSTGFSSIKKFVTQCVLPATGRSRPSQLGTDLSTNPEFKYKRLTIQTEDLSIDATLMGTSDTLQNKNWILPSLGNMEIYEDKLLSPSFQRFLKESKSNAILFNYPGVGSSLGSPSSKTATKAYQAILRFLEDEEAGIGAKKILGYGFSLGGGVQGESLKTYPLEKGLDKGIQYVFVKDRTFSNLRNAAKSFAGFLAYAVPYLGWDLDSIESSKRLSNLKIPEIIIQATNRNGTAISDGVISADASLKKRISDDLNLSHKLYIDLRSTSPKTLHNASLDPTMIATYTQRVASHLQAIDFKKVS